MKLTKLQKRIVDQHNLDVRVINGETVVIDNC